MKELFIVKRLKKSDYTWNMKGVFDSYEQARNKIIKTLHGEYESRTNDSGIEVYFTGKDINNSEYKIESKQQ